MKNPLNDHDFLIKIAKEFGTPVYIYSKYVINRQIQQLQSFFKDLPYELHYAMKANENPEILKIMLQNGLGVDAVSVNEIKRALSVGFPKEKIIYTPSCPSEEELLFGLSHQIHTHVGATEYFDIILKKFPYTSIGLRINPGNQIGGNQKIATAHNDSKFGIPINQLDIIKRYIDKGLKVDSLHLHTGSDVHTWLDLARSADVIFDFAKHFDRLKYIDLGSGFKVKYHPDDKAINLQAYAGYIKHKIDALPYPVRIKFEPGKFLVSESGVFLVKVNIVKQGYHKKFVGVNSGFHHFIRPMYYDAYHEIVNLSNNEPTTEKYDVVGVLCEEDTFARNRWLSHVQKDDILMIKNAGAYGFSMSSEYNLRHKPQEILITDNRIEKI